MMSTSESGRKDDQRFIMPERKQSHLDLCLFLVHRHHLSNSGKTIQIRLFHPPLKSCSPTHGHHLKSTFLQNAGLSGPLVLPVHRFKRWTRLDGGEVELRVGAATSPAQRLRQARMGSGGFGDHRRAWRRRSAMDCVPDCVWVESGRNSGVHVLFCLLSFSSGRKPV